MNQSFDIEKITVETFSPAVARRIIEIAYNEYPEQLDRLQQRHILQWVIGENHELVVVKPITANEKENNSPIIGFIHLSLHEGKMWFSMAIERKYQRRGIGTALLNYAKQKTNELHGWIIPDDSLKKPDGTPYYSPKKFYLKNGFELTDNFMPLRGKRIVVQEIVWRKPSP